MVVLLVFYYGSLVSLPLERDTQSDATVIFFDQSTTMGYLQYLAAVAAFVPPLLFWVSTALLLKHYAKNTGKLKFWIIMSVPLIFIVIQPVLIAPFLYSFSDPSAEPIHITVLGDMLPGIIGGIIFGIPFLMARGSLRYVNRLKDYLVVTSFGFMLWMVSIHMSVHNAAYPPFGLTTVFCTAISSYMIVFGLYSSAITISRDSNLRQSIRRSVFSEAKFLDSIGSADMQIRIEKEISKIVKSATFTMEQKEFKPSPSEDEIKQYIDEALDEVKKIKKIR